MNRIVFALLLSGFVFLYTFPANAEYWEEPLVDQHWNFSLAPGYGFLYVADEAKLRNGFGGRLLGHYSFTNNWGLELKIRLGIFDGDNDKGEGLYTQISTTAGVRYTFQVREWFHPYVFFGLGWIRTELDHEINRIYTANSLFLEPGGGFSFRITRNFWLGLETTLSPMFFGDDRINSSFTFQSLISAELHL